MANFVAFVSQALLAIVINAGNIWPDVPEQTCSLSPWNEFDIYYE